MSDKAHDWTDDRIDELSAKFQRQYEQAAKEMQSKLDTWLDDYDRKRKVWEDDVSSGRRTQDEYDAWLKGRAFDKSWQQEMIDTLSYDAMNIDRLAMDAINDELPRIYAENANFTAYTIDKGIGMNTGFTLVDQDTVRRLMMDNPDLVPAYRIDQPKDYVWNQQKFNSAITQGILQGESIPAISKRVESVIGMDKRAATRSARTACTAAESMGRQSSYKRAQDLGIGIRQRWMATLDLRTRHTHRLLDKQTVQVGQKFCPKGYGEKHALRFPADPQGLAEEVFNCFIGETLVAADSPIERSYQHEYSGDLVTIDTASGVHFTCTPNHPILTPRGWVAAKCLNNGDDLLVTGRTNENAFSWWNPDVNHRFTSMETVHELLYMLTRKRTRKLGVNFHGDIATSDVEVVAKESFLRFCLNAVRNKSVVEILLKRADTSDFCESTHMKGLMGVMSSASRIMGGFGVLAAFLWGHGSHPDVHGLRTASSLDTCLAEYAIDNLPTETVIRGELLGGLSRQVFADKIVGVKVSSTFGTHVYNLQTGNGYYFVNESNNGNFIIAKNCRCTTIAVLDDDDYEDDERWSRLPDGMTYEEWKNEATQDKKRNTAKSADVYTTDDIGMKPTRPRRGDFATRDEYVAAREKYRQDLDEFESRKRKLIDEITSRPNHGYMSDDSIAEWSEKTGVKVSSDALKQVDRRILDESVHTLDSLFKKYPQVLENYESFGKKFTIDIEREGIDCIMEATGGLNISVKHIPTYELAVENTVNGYTTSTYNEYVERSLRLYGRGDGTFATQVTHEFGHNLDHAVRQKFIYTDEYGDAAFTHEYDSYEKELLELTKKHTTSDYSLTNHLEAFAEGFAEYECNPQSNYAKAFGEFLRRWL